MKASVDKDLCFGCGVCTDVCPEVFQVGSDKKVQVLVDPIPAELEERCREAVDRCPESAITLHDA
ncbi:MAG: ferredoxin [Thermoguttaceae bacterium]